MDAAPLTLSSILSSRDAYVGYFKDDAGRRHLFRVRDGKLLGDNIHLLNALPAKNVVFRPYNAKSNNNDDAPRGPPEIADPPFATLAQGGGCAEPDPGDVVTTLAKNPIAHIGLGGFAARPMTAESSIRSGLRNTEELLATKGNQYLATGGSVRQHLRGKYEADDPRKLFAPPSRSRGTGATGGTEEGVGSPALKGRAVWEALVAASQKTSADSGRGRFVPWDGARGGVDEEDHKPAVVRPRVDDHLLRPSDIIASSSQKASKQSSKQSVGSAGARAKRAQAKKPAKPKSRLKQDQVAFIDAHLLPSPLAENRDPALPPPEKPPTAVDLWKRNPDRGSCRTTRDGFATNVTYTNAAPIMSRYGDERVLKAPLRRSIMTTIIPPPLGGIDWSVSRPPAAAVGRNGGTSGAAASGAKKGGESANYLVANAGGMFICVEKFDPGMRGGRGGGK